MGRGGDHLQAATQEVHRREVARDGRQVQRSRLSALRLPPAAARLRRRREDRRARLRPTSPRLTAPPQRSHANPNVPWACAVNSLRAFTFSLLKQDFLEQLERREYQQVWRIRMPELCHGLYPWPYPFGPPFPSTMPASPPHSEARLHESGAPAWIARVLLRMSLDALVAHHRSRLLLPPHLPAPAPKTAHPPSARRSTT